MSEKVKKKSKNKPLFLTKINNITTSYRLKSGIKKIINKKKEKKEKVKLQKQFALVRSNFPKENSSDPQTFL